MNTAVLLVAFNRPDTTAQVFEAIRRARPPRLYFAVDGPRVSRPGEADRCAQVRRIAEEVDWPCAVRTLFRDDNLGCKRGVSSAIDWFFTQEEQGIILEDDCIPSRSFFRLCEELLDRFKSDPRVFAVQGTFFGSTRKPHASYLFSRMFHMWGWATWADRWRAVSIDTPHVTGVRESLIDVSWLGKSKLVRDYWLDVLALQAGGGIDSWGNPVQFHCFGRKLFNVTPTSNLVLNIGVGPSATRTAALVCGPFHRQALDMPFPLVHAAEYQGAEELLPFELRWRTQLTPWRLVRQAMHYRYPRAYGFLRTAFGTLRRRQ